MVWILVALSALPNVFPPRVPGVRLRYAIPLFKDLTTCLK